MLLPEALTAQLVRRFLARHREWLAGGDWPMAVSLGIPTEKLAAEDPASVRRWVEAWAGWTGPGVVRWEERRWARLGAQRLPAAIEFAGPGDIANLAGEAPRWAVAAGRYRQMIERWPTLAQSAVLGRQFDVLADYASPDFERLCALLDWALQHPDSGLPLRQLPIEGLHTKWLEQRAAVVTALLRALRNAPADADLHALLGLQRTAYRVRLRLLCPSLRSAVGGLDDIEAPIGALMALPIAPRRVIVVENLDTGLALRPRDDTVCLMKLGLAAGVLGTLPWVTTAPQVLYWGDIDTHGFVALDRARQALPQTQSVLMDEATLLGYRALWSEERVQADGELPALTDAERSVFSGLGEQRWGANVRLEQERVPMAYAESVLDGRC